jgi:hypothetical protein
MGSPYPVTPNTAVPFPQLGPTGVTTPNEAQILAGVIADINAAFGGNLNFNNLSTPQGQLAMSFTAIIGNSFALFQWFCNMVDPAFSVGRMQDAIARIYFIERIAGAPTLINCVCGGQDGTILPIGVAAQDQSGNVWISIGGGTIYLGTVTLQFQCANNGPTPPPTSMSIYENINGWESVAPTGQAVIGNYAETASQFEARRAASTGLNSMGPLNATYGQVLQVPGVLDGYITQNNSSGSLLVGGVTLLPNSMYVCVLGGDDTAVATAIYMTKMPGCNMSGNTTISIPDPNPAYIPPPPTTNITFQRPQMVSFSVVVSIRNSAAVPNTALVEIQQAVINAFAGLDGGPRAKIGSQIFGSRYYNPVMALGLTYLGQTGGSISGWSTPIVSILLGTTGTQAAFTGGISANVLTVSAMAGGAITVGSLIELAAGGGPALLVVGQTGGTTGGVGTYQLSQSLANPLTSQSMMATAQLNSVTLNINQAPVVAAPNIYLNLI